MPWLGAVVVPSLPPRGGAESVHPVPNHSGVASDQEEMELNGVLVSAAHSHADSLRCRVIHSFRRSIIIGLESYEVQQQQRQQQQQRRVSLLRPWAASSSTRLEPSTGTTPPSRGAPPPRSSVRGAARIAISNISTAVTTPHASVASISPSSNRRHHHHLYH
ncbi:unnamed protein product [Lampetra fluviatilis]